MAVDMEEVLGADNMHPAQRDRVMELLQSLPLPTIADVKHAFFAWAAQVGYRATAQDAAKFGLRKKRRPR